MFPLGERKNLASLASAGEATVSVRAMLRRRERRMGRYYTRRAAIRTPGIPADASTAAVVAAAYARRPVNERSSARKRLASRYERGSRRCSRMTAHNRTVDPEAQRHARLGPAFPAAMAEVGAVVEQDLRRCSRRQRQEPRGSVCLYPACSTLALLAYTPKSRRSRRISF